jgi:translation initiation factor 2 beta subunit (eIF-2beta)/eIF-5
LNSSEWGQERISEIWHSGDGNVNLRADWKKLAKDINETTKSNYEILEQLRRDAEHLMEYLSKGESEKKKGKDRNQKEERRGSG